MDQTDDATPLAPTVPRVLAWVWLGVVALLLIDLAVRGRDSASLIAAAVLLFSAGVAYVLWLRPRVVPGADGVKVVNPLRDTFVPWSAFTWADVTDVVRVHAGSTVVRSWALRETKRAKVRENLRRDSGLSDRDPVADADPRDLRPAELQALELRRAAERRKAAVPDPAAARSGAAPGGVVAGWAPDAVGALGGPVALLLVILLLF
ncbi:PH domain-containing protein [Nocardiopsis coralliicola]